MNQQRWSKIFQLRPKKQSRLDTTPLPGEDVEKGQEGSGCILVQKIYYICCRIFHQDLFFKSIGKVLSYQGYFVPFFFGYVFCFFVGEKGQKKC